MQESRCSSHSFCLILGSHRWTIDSRPTTTIPSQPLASDQVRCQIPVHSPNTHREESPRGLQLEGEVEHDIVG